MNPPTVFELYQSCGDPCRRGEIEIDEATGKYQNTRHMKPPVQRIAGFSLVEITLALGVAALCLIVLLGLLAVGVKTQQASMQQTTANDITSMILGDLRADVRLPPGQASKEGDSGFGLHGHWLAVSTPDTLYFTNQAKWTGTLNAAPDPAAGGQAAGGDPGAARLQRLFLRLRHAGRAGQCIRG